MLNVAAAVRAGTLFGISANTVRVALARLTACGRIESVERGSYRLGHAARAMSSDVATWRETERHLRRWEGAWVAAATSGLPKTDRGAVRIRLRACALLGMRELAPGLFVRPDNFTGGVDQVRTRLRSLGLETSAPVFLASALDEETDRRAQGLWDVGDLEQRYREGRRLLETSLAGLAELSPDDAARETYLIGDHALHMLVFDPWLPESLLATHERHAFVDAMRRYDAAGQAIWRRFLFACA
ncbi:hypothetical protein OS187_00675 [Xanthomonadaceae bacterium JHOS43]|nr:hypothetical protein [Xanthomonadaceae bacterium JHOS43]